MNLCEILEKLNYDPITGKFTWKVRTHGHGGRKDIGDEAGGPAAGGYLRIGINGKRYLAHRIAWLIMTGYDPTHLETDHVDGCKTNNALSNLRLAARSENNHHQRKLRKDNTSGFRGVSYCSDRKTRT